ncbi:MAG: hypothetical protein DRJ03_18650 [Chloroflexi bacterium]|nr:MAG: hypothetical protein DRJ03_18650 [Chloroflexota bacterium]
MSDQVEVKELKAPAGTSPQGAEVPVRFRLADERKSKTVKFTLQLRDLEGKDHNIKGYFTIGFYDDGTPGEVFISTGKTGEDLRGFANSWAIGISMLLQYGIPPEKIYAKFAHQRFQPNGISGVPAVPIAKSLVDLVVRWMEAHLPPTATYSSTVDKEWAGIVEEVTSG